MRDNLNEHAPHMRPDADPAPEELAVVVRCWIGLALLSLVVLLFLRVYR